MYSTVLDLELWMKENGGTGMPYVLRLYDPTMATWLATPAEEAAARRAAEVRIAELQTEVEHLRAELAVQRKTPTGEE